MAEIVGAFALPHTPFFPALAAAGGPPGEELKRLYGAVVDLFAAAAPDCTAIEVPGGHGVGGAVLPDDYLGTIIDFFKDHAP